MSFVFGEVEATSQGEATAKDSSLTGGLMRGITGPLQPIPFNATSVASAGTGSSASITNGSSGQANRDGSGNRCILTAAAVGPPSMALIRDIVHGRTVGVRWLRSQGQPAFDVVIDGVAYAIDNAEARRDNQVITITDIEVRWIVATGLADREHTVEVHVEGDPAGAVAKVLTLHGWMGESGRGYIPPPVMPPTAAATVSTISVPTASTQIPLAGRFLYGVHFFNTDSVSHTVTITGPDASATWSKVVVGAGLEADWTLTPPRPGTNYKWSVDSGGTANTVHGWANTA